MLFRISINSTSRTFDVCAAALSELTRRQTLTITKPGEPSAELLLEDVENIERVRLARGSLLPHCDHHGRGLGYCP